VAQALIQACASEGMIKSTQGTIRAMADKAGVISDSASQVLSFVRTQMPYPYVQLVSFTVHFYLFFWATYVGCLLNGGTPDGVVTETARWGALGVGRDDAASADNAWVRPHASSFLFLCYSQASSRPTAPLE
jgi:hypothetical protein